MQQRITPGTMPSAAPGFDQLGSMLAMQRKMLEHVEATSRLWSDALQDALDSGADLSSRLARCNSSEDLPGVYHGWLIERMERATTVGQRSTALWLDLVRFSAANGYSMLTPERNGMAHGGRRESLRPEARRARR